MAILRWAESANAWLAYVATVPAGIRYYVCKSQPVAGGADPTGSRIFAAMKENGDSTYDYTYCYYNPTDGYDPVFSDASVDLSEVTDLIEGLALSNGFFALCEQSDYDAMIAIIDPP